MDSAKVTIRLALIDDIPAMQYIRNAVSENVLSDPSLVPDADYGTFITSKGQGWVAEINQLIAGFAFVDMERHNVWALFVDPAFERRGIGRLLHDTMVDWYFTQTKTPLWLGTGYNTRAEQFYRSAGWIEVGKHGDDEIKFEMRWEDWESKRF